MADPKALLDGLTRPTTPIIDYTLELPNGVKITTDGSAKDHEQAKELALALASPQPAAKPVGLLSERMETFLKQMALQGRSKTNLLDTRFTLGLFLALTGDRDLAEVDVDDLDTFMDALAHWPANASKKRAYRDLTPQQVVAKAKERDDPKLAPRTREKHLDRLRVFFRNCVDRRLLRFNPCDGLRVTSKQQDNTPTRQPFTEADLHRLFAPERPTYVQPHKFWMPALALYTGARVNELAQLHVEDVEQVDGIWGLHFRRQLKNQASRRFLPLHPKLIELGFVAYVKEVKAAQFEHVFPGLSWGIHGPGDSVGDWFNRSFLRRICGIDDPSKTFHSFRHTFASLAERSGLSDQRIARLTGHSNGGSTLRRHYIQVANLRERRDDLAKVVFPALPHKTVKKGFFAPYFRRTKAVQARKARLGT